MTIPKITPYSGGVANPDGSQTQTEFTQNMFDQLSYEANLATELDATIDGMNNTVDEVNASASSAENSANAAEAAASGLNYKGLWPDTGGIANKGETWQTQVSGTGTGQYFTALQDTTVDPVGDDLNWRAVVSFSLISGENLISNSSFEIAGSVTNPPDLTSRDYNAGDELFQGVFAAENLAGVTYANGELNGSGQLYTDVFKSEKQKLSTASYVASIASSDGVAVESGASFVDNGDYWRVTYDMNDTFSVKLEQGSVSTRHGAKSLFDIYGHPNMGIYDPRALGAKPIQGFDNSNYLQAALDEWGVAELRDNQYEISTPIVMKTGNRVSGERFKAKLLKTSNLSYTSPTTGATSDCAIFLDDSPYNFYSTISGVDIISDAPSRMDCSIYTGNSAHLNLEYIRCDADAMYGLRGTSLWMSSLTHVRVGQSYSWGFYFPLTGLGTSVHLSNCYAEACGGGYLFSNCTYSTMTSCGADYTNTGNKPGNPYSRAGGDYQSESSIFRFSACDFTLNSCGTENSTANYLYCEGSFLTFNSCYTTQLENYVPGVVNTIGVRGVAASSVTMNSSRISCENMIDSELRGVFIENPDEQSIVCDLLPSFQGYREGNAYSSLNDISITTKNNILADPSFKQRVPELQSQFQARYDSSYTDSTLSYIDSNNDGTFSLRFSGDSSSAPDGAQINTKWRVYINRPLNKADRAFLSVKGQYSTGDYGNPRIKVMEADSSLDLGSEIASYPVAGISDGDYMPIDLSTATKPVIFLEITIFYKGSFINADKIDFFTCSTSGRLDD